MFSKLALRNVRRSFRDYGVYLLTLTFGVCLFYTFNSLEGQGAMVYLARNGSPMVEVIQACIRIFSVFVAVVLACLILYANRFLLRRRKRELGTYLLLGLGQGQVSLVLVLETGLVALVSLALGLALGAKMRGKDFTTYLILGDGECDEGQVWEGALSAAHLKLDNLIAFVDWNKQQLDGAVDDVLDLGDIGQKFEDFGWHVQKVNGHDIDALLEAVESAKAHKGQPSMIVLDTIKGNGCRLAMETFPCHHLKFKPEQIAPSVIEAEQVLAKAREALEVR